MKDLLLRGRKKEAVVDRKEYERERETETEFGAEKIT